MRVEPITATVPRLCVPQPRRRADKNQIAHFRNCFLQTNHYPHSLLASIDIRVEQLDQPLFGFKRAEQLAQPLSIGLARNQVGDSNNKDRLQRSPVPVRPCGRVR